MIVLCRTAILSFWHFPYSIWLNLASLMFLGMALLVSQTVVHCFNSTIFLRQPTHHAFSSTQKDKIGQFYGLVCILQLLLTLFESSKLKEFEFTIVILKCLFPLFIFLQTNLCKAYSLFMHTKFTLTLSKLARTNSNRLYPYVLLFSVFCCLNHFLSCLELIIPLG